MTKDKKIEEKKPKTEEKNPEKEEVKKEKKSEEKTDEKEVKKVEEKAVKKKEEIKPKEKAFVNGNNLHLSLKHCKWICRMIKGKTPEKAVKMLEEVVKRKRAVPMPTLEVGHQKGKGISGARFPKNASVGIIELLKQLQANSNVNMIENPVIVIAKANKASMPFRRNRRRAKRCHVYIEVKDRNKLEKE